MNVRRIRDSFQPRGKRDIETPETIPTMKSAHQHQETATHPHPDHPFAETRRNKACSPSLSRRTFLASAAVGGMASFLLHSPANAADSPIPDQPLELIGNRFLTFNTVVRVNQIEISRDRTAGADELKFHTPEAATAFRQAIERGWPEGKITWAFSWLALHDERPNYKAIRKLVLEFHKKHGDEITFIPGGYFQPMYNTRKQTERDLHEALARISEMVGGGYRPRSILAGFLDAASLKYLADHENIHVCQGNIWSQYAIDNGDGDGAVCYPYYPSTEHFCKPAQSQADFIDCVNLDGWTCDFLAARRAGFADGFNSRMGVGPIETIFAHGPERGVQEMLHTTAVHFDRGFDLNRFAWVTDCWELCLQGDRGPRAKSDLECLTRWLSEIRRRWPSAKLVTQGEFGEACRRHYRDNSFDYRFEQRGSGIGGSDANIEIRWFMNRDFRLALLRDWKAGGPELVIDFTRYGLKAQEPADPQPGGATRNWSLMNRINMKRTRPQDTPVRFAELTQEEQDLIVQRYPSINK
jgi:hypothetical protein